jgi:dual specificity MAP kinase phosphatase
LHGLEGENEAQNSFFASAPNAHETHMYTQTQHPRVKVPKYRGLVCVVCEEDLVADGDAVSLRILRRKNGQIATSAISSPSSSMYSSSSESYEEDDDEVLELEEKCSQGCHLNNCVGVAAADENGMRISHENTMPMPICHEPTKDNNLARDPNTGTHMHPVSHRSIHPPAPIPLPSSVSSSITSASSATSFSFDHPTPCSGPPESDMTSLSSCPPSPVPMLDGHVPM